MNKHRLSQTPRTTDPLIKFCRNFYAKQYTCQLVYKTCYKPDSWDEQGVWDWIKKNATEEQCQYINEQYEKNDHLGDYPLATTLNDYLEKFDHEWYVEFKRI